jgi:hypothetical protein
VVKELFLSAKPPPLRGEDAVLQRCAPSTAREL